MISGLFILLVTPPLRGSRLGCFLSSVVAKHLLHVGPSAASIQASAPEGLLQLPEPPRAG